MSAVIIAYRAGDVVCACIPQVAVIADMVPEPVLRAKLDALAVGEPEWVEADEYRAAHRSAIVGNLDELNEVAETIEDDRVRAEMLGKIAELRLYCERFDERLAELVELKRAEHAQRQRVIEISAQQEKRFAEQKAEQAKADDEAKWLDVGVTEGPGGVEVVKHFRAFERWNGREPEFRKYTQILKRYAPGEAIPPDVVARIGRPIKYSAEYLAVPTHPYDRGR